MSTDLMVPERHPLPGRSPAHRHERRRTTLDLLELEGAPASAAAVPARQPAVAAPSIHPQTTGATP